MKNRNSHIELLRIIAMLLIIAHHFSFHGALSGMDGNELTFNIIFSQMLYAGGKLGVDLFVIISGYFMLSSAFHSSRLVVLSIQVWTYSIVLMAVSIILGGSTSITNFITSLFPIAYGKYWFISCYFLLVLISPIINAFLKFTSRRQVISITVILVIVTFAMPSFGNMELGDSNIMRFITMYLIGAQLRINQSLIAEKGRKYAKDLLWGCSGVLLISIICMDAVGYFLQIPPFITHAVHFTSESSIFSLGVAVALVFLMVTADFYSNRFINVISKSVFGVYLFHDNYFIRELLWNKLLRPKYWMLNVGPVEFVMFSIVSVLGIFVVGVIVESIRRVIFDKPTTSIIVLLRPILDRIDHSINFLNNSSTVISESSKHI